MIKYNYQYKPNPHMRYGFNKYPAKVHKAPHRSHFSGSYLETGMGTPRSIATLGSLVSV